MSLLSEPTASVAACPRCGLTTADATIGGLCPRCLARGGLEPTTGWLVSTTTGATEDWPTLDGWRITGVLGAGGMGRVFQGELRTDGTPGALKVLDARWSQDPQAAARFESEIEALWRLEHPNIVRVIEITETDDGRLCLVMDFVDGCDLGRLLRAERLPPERAVEIFRKVCAAVMHAHERGVIHRDIKPANILVGGDGTVKLADFGLAKDVAADAGGASPVGGLTGTTDQFGTAYYIAPERFQRGAAAGKPGDVFALGVLLYHLLAGRMPLGKFTPLSKLTGLPAAIDRIVARALEADPAQRTATVAELDRAVGAMWDEHLAGTGRVRRWKRIRTAAIIVFCTVATAATGAWWQRHRTKPAPPIVFAPAASATTEKPWENSLGMKFVPVPGTRVLFSLWETRRRDCEPYIQADFVNAKSWRADELARMRKRAGGSVLKPDDEGNLVPNGTWADPGFPVTPDHPAGGIGIRDAQRYCLWLTWKEVGEGRIQPGQRYRLPTNAEWLAACGGENATPRPGNLAGPEARIDKWPDKFATLARSDPFPRSAPVGSFPPELHGLYDISGNVTEWTLDEDESTASRATRSEGQLRGPSWLDRSEENIRFSFTRRPWYAAHLPNIGFRVVLELAPDAK